MSRARLRRIGARRQRAERERRELERAEVLAQLADLLRPLVSAAIEGIKRQTTERGEPWPTTE